MQHKHSATIFYVLVSPISKDESVRLKNIITTITHHFRQKAQYQDILPSARPLVIPHMNPPTVSPHPSLAKNPNLWVLCQVLVKVRVFTSYKTKNTISTEVIKTESLIWLLIAYFYDNIDNIDRKLQSTVITYRIPKKSTYLNIKHFRISLLLHPLLLKHSIPHPNTA